MSIQGQQNMLVMTAATGSSTTCSSGNSYSGAAGTVLTAPYWDAIELAANGWILPVGTGGTGTTAQRPTWATPGTTYYDTTLPATMLWDGATWRHPVTGVAG